MSRRYAAAALGLVCVSVGVAACASATERGLVRPTGEASAAVGCGEGASNPNALAAGWRATSVVSGPLTLAYIKGYASQRRGAFAPVRLQLRRILAGRASDRERRLARRSLEQAAPDSYGVAKVLVRVAGGEQATLAVAADQRSSVALIYARRARNAEHRGAPGAYRVADGDPAVTFRACPSANTDFLGGIVVGGARCVTLTVASPGRRPGRLRLPFGRRTCDPSTRPTALRQRFLRRAPRRCAAGSVRSCLARGPGQWNYATTTTVLPGPGCYAFRLRGEFDQRIVFQAVLLPPAEGVASRTRGDGR